MLTEEQIKKDPLRYRRQYEGIIKNLINNIDICNKGYVDTGDEGYLAARKKYIQEVEELKTKIIDEEIRLGLYKRRCSCGHDPVECDCKAGCKCGCRKQYLGN